MYRGPDEPVVTLTLKFELYIFQMNIFSNVQRELRDLFKVRELWFHGVPALRICVSIYIQSISTIDIVLLLSFGLNFLIT